MLNHQINCLGGLVEDMCLVYIDSCCCEWEVFVLLVGGVYLGGVS